MEYGAKIGHPPMEVISPKARRNIGRKTDKQTAQWTQECLLGRLNNDEEPLSPENVAAIKGSGSFYDDNGCFDARLGKCLIKKLLSRSEVANNTDKGVLMPTPSNELEKGYSEEKSGAKNIDFEFMKLRTHNMMEKGYNEEKNGDKNIHVESTKRTSLFCDSTKVPFTLNVVTTSRVQRHKGKENRFGGDDDYANNFEDFTPPQDKYGISH